MSDNTIVQNRHAKHEYFVVESYETGIVLQGCEIKSLRLGNVNLADSFCLITKDGVVLKNAHIGRYEKSDAFSSADTRRDRKLLLRKSEILRLTAKVNQKGFTLVPLELYFKQSLVKVRLGLCQGKHTYDKKKTLMDKDIKRQSEREIKKYK